MVSWKQHVLILTIDIMQPLFATWVSCQAAQAERNLSRITLVSPPGKKRRLLTWIYEGVKRNVTFWKLTIIIRTCWKLWEHCDTHGEDWTCTTAPSHSQTVAVSVVTVIRHVADQHQGGRKMIQAEIMLVSCPDMQVGSGEPTATKTSLHWRGMRPGSMRPGDTGHGRVEKWLRSCFCVKTWWKSCRGSFLLGKYHLKGTTTNTFFFSWHFLVNTNKISGQY